jgi:tetratricopeptide (TPR) repeat protein
MPDEVVRPIGAFPRLTEAERDLRDGRFDAAAAQVIQHLRERPNEPRGVALLGRIALRTGALVQAEQFLRQAMDLGGAGDLDAQRDLASAIYQQDRLGDALNAFTFLEQRIPDPQITGTRALILDKLGRSDQALAAHRALVEREPDNAQFWITYGHSLRAAGETDDAIAAYRRAIEIDDERGEAWWSLANIKSKVLTDTDIAQMEAALASAVDIINIVPLHMALGRAWQDAGQHEKAFRHYAEGNRLRAETINYRADELTEEVDEFVRDFGADFFQRERDAPSSGPVPIFLISMPRSGSTLLEQMLDQHPKIEAVGELPYVRALLRSAMEIHTRREPIKVPQLITRLSERERQALGADYLQRASLHRKTDAPFFVDKMPMNWSDLLFIRQILPQARFIEIRRNAMDCCLSNFVHYFSRAHAASFDLGDIGRFYVDYVRLMDHLDAVAPGLVHHIRYEALVEDPEPQLRGALDYLGLDWDPATLRFYESDRIVRTPSAEQVRRPLNKSGMGAWQPYAQWLRPLREALGPLADA